MIFNHVVEIQPVKDTQFPDNPDIGMFAGVIRWVVSYDDIYTTLNSSDKFLSENWVSELSKSANITRSGTYASIGGGTLNVLSTTKLFKWLSDYNISLYNAIVTIKQNRNGGAYYKIRTGVISQSQDNIVGGQIPFDDISRSTSTTLSKQIEDSNEFYPINFGNINKAKFVSVDNPYNLTLPVKLGDYYPVFRVTVNNATEAVLNIPFVDLPTQQQALDYLRAVVSIVSEGALAVEQEGRLFPVKSVVYDSNPTTGDFCTITFYDYNDIVNGVKSSGSNVSKYLTFAILSQENFSDFFPGEILRNNIYNFTDDKFIALPYVREAEQYTDNSIKQKDSDSTGYTLIPMTPVTFGTQYDSLSGVIKNYNYSTSGNLSNIVDGDRSTAFEITLGRDVPPVTSTRQMLCRYRLKIDGMEKQDSLIFATRAGSQVITEAGGDVFNGSWGFRVWFIVIDAFGNSYNIYGTNPWQNTPYNWTYRSDGIDWDNTCYAYTEDNDTYRWKWAGAATVGGRPAGVQSTLDLSSLPEMVWKTGFELEVNYEYYSDVFPTPYILKIKMSCYEIQLLTKTTYNPKEVYTSVKGRDDQDGSLITTPQGVYKHCLKLQNYNNRGVPQPLGGWGKEYPAITDWTGFYVDSDFDFDLGYPPYQLETAYQIFGETTTELVKADICKDLWGLGFQDRSGLERFVYLNEALYNTDGVLIEYGNLYNMELPTVKDRKFSDIFTNVTINYGYNPATGEGSNKRVITPDPIDLDVDRQYSQALFGVYNVQNRCPETISRIKYDTDPNYQWIEKFYNWQGAIRDAGGVVTVKKRYTVSFDVPYSFGIDNSLDIGSKIRLQIPNMTYYGAVPNAHSGVIYAIDEDIASSTPKMSIRAEMVGDDLAGSDRTIIRETGLSETIIRESGTQINRLREGYYGN